MIKWKKKISNNFVPESFFFFKVIFFFSYCLTDVKSFSYIFCFLNLHQTQKVKSSIITPTVTRTYPVSSQKQRPSISLSVLLQRCVGIPNLHLRNAGSVFLILTIWTLEVILTVGAEGGHLGSSAGTGAGVCVGLRGSRRGHLPFLPVFDDIVSATSHITPSRPCQWWQWELGPSAFFVCLFLCFLSFRLLLHPRILTLQSLVPAALSVTFNWWRHSKRAVMASLVSQGLDPVWCEWIWTKLGMNCSAVTARMLWVKERIFSVQKRA